jgi:hypothetical protein
VWCLEKIPHLSPSQSLLRGICVNLPILEIKEPYYKGGTKESLLTSLPV